MWTSFLNWTKKPVTWGACLKLCGVCLLLSAVVTNICVFWSRIESLGEKTVGKVKSVLRK